MIYLAKLLDDLIFTYSTNKKIKLLVDYLQSRNGEERGYTISILTGRLTFNNIKKTQVLNVVKNHIDQFLFEQSYDYVGDLAETIALIWPEKK